MPKTARSGKGSAPTAKQKKFCAEYLKDCNATQAAIRAGYSAKTADSQGIQLLRNLKVSAHLETLQEKAGKRNDLTVDWVLSRLKENAERAMQAVEVLDREGKPTGEYKYDGNVANRALELIGKHLGMFNDKVLVTEGDEPTLVKTFDSDLARAFKSAAAHPN